MTDTKVKENAIVDFMEMTYHSWKRKGFKNFKGGV